MNLHNLKIDRSWTLFLDRDGVINRRRVDDYVKSWDQFEFLPGVTGAMKKFKLIFGRIIIVTNQQGIGKGLMTEQQVLTVHQQMLDAIRHDGGNVDAVFHAPHLHSDRSFMRKPGIGMALKARRMFPEIHFKRSVMAGDSLSDMIFGKRVGMTTVLISPDASLAKSNPKQINHSFPDLLSLSDAIQSSI